VVVAAVLLGLDELAAGCVGSGVDAVAVAVNRYLDKKYL